jgi:DUF1365 family protein
MHSAIFEGRLKHRRVTPVAHEFEYRLFMMYLDLAELDDVFRGRWLWSARRRAFAQFRRGDHFGDAAEPLDECVRRRVLQATGRRPEGPIRLLTHLSYCGYCFNPVSFFYCFDRTGRDVVAIVAEVNNTPWGERRLYVLDETSRIGSGRRAQFETPKAMHVSPFMAMDVGYRWRFVTADKRLIVHMQTADRGTKVFDATLTLERTEISGRSLARVLLRYPLMTLEVIAAIHWQALKLWLKGAPVYGHTPTTKVLESRS